MPKMWDKILKKASGTEQSWCKRALTSTENSEASVVVRAKPRRTQGGHHDGITLCHKPATCHGI